MALVKCKECGNQVSTEAKACPSCGAKPPKKTSLFTWIVVAFIGFVVISAMVGGGGSGGSNSTTSAVSAPPPKNPRTLAMESVQLKNFSWTKGAFETVMMANFTVENTGDRPVKDLEFSCEHTAKSGTVIDRNKKVIYDTVPAKGRKTFKDFNMGFIHSQADRSSCSITDLKPM